MLFELPSVWMIWHKYIVLKRTQLIEREKKEKKKKARKPVALGYVEYYAREKCGFADFSESKGEKVTVLMTCLKGFACAEYGRVRIRQRCTYDSIK